MGTIVSERACLRQNRSRTIMAFTMLGAFAALLAAAVVTPPPVNAPFDYQIGGAYPPRRRSRRRPRPARRRPRPASYDVCYVNAFQTQPDEATWWKTNHDDLLLRRRRAPTWSTASGTRCCSTRRPRRSARRCARVVGGWIDGCRRSGLQRGRARQPRLATAGAQAADQAGQHRLRQAARRARARGGPGDRAEERPPTRRRTASASGFDFAIAEECQATTSAATTPSAYGEPGRSRSSTPTTAAGRTSQGVQRPRARGLGHLPRPRRRGARDRGLRLRRLLIRRRSRGGRAGPRRRASRGGRGR